MIRDLLLAAAGNAVVPPSGAGQIEFTATGQWVVPAGVTAISAVAVGPSSGNKGGGLSYSNNIAVIPGETLDISILTSSNGSSLLRSSTVLLRAVKGTTTSSAVGDAVFAGGAAGSAWGAGGGAGGYAGAGGAGGSADSTDGTAGTGGAGGGGYSGTSTATSAGGGGVGLKGLGASGAGGTLASPGGKGGSGGAAGALARVGGLYGGGGLVAVAGAIRIMWGGGRSYPNNAGDV